MRRKLDLVSFCEAMVRVKSIPRRAGPYVDTPTPRRVALQPATPTTKRLGDDEGLSYEGLPSGGLKGWDDMVARLEEKYSKPKKKRKASKKKKKMKKKKSTKAVKWVKDTVTWEQISRKLPAELKKRKIKFTPYTSVNQVIRALKLNAVKVDRILWS